MPEGLRAVGLEIRPANVSVCTKRNDYIHPAPHVSNGSSTLKVPSRSDTAPGLICGSSGKRFQTVPTPRMAGARAFSAEADPPNDPAGLALVKRKTIRRRVLALGSSGVSRSCARGERPAGGFRRRLQRDSRYPYRSRSAALKGTTPLPPWCCKRLQARRSPSRAFGSHSHMPARSKYRARRIYSITISSLSSRPPAFFAVTRMYFTDGAFTSARNTRTRSSPSRATSCSHAVR